MKLWSWLLLGGILSGGLVGGYVLPAQHAASAFLRNLNMHDANAIDTSIDWQTATPSFANLVATSFSDPNAAQLSSIVTSTFKARYLAAVNNPKLRLTPVGISKGFTNFDEYTIRSPTGNTWTFRRYGFRWLLARIVVDQSAARLYTIQMLRDVHPDAEFSLFHKDLYFDAPNLGVRITDSADLTDFALTHTAVSALLAFVRNVPDDDQNAFVKGAHTQVWALNCNLTTDLLLNGNQSDGTDGASNLTYTSDDRSLYFNVLAAPVSDAIATLDIAARKVRVVGMGNTVHFVESGKYAGTLITERHKYRDEGGAYELPLIINLKGDEIAHDSHELDGDKQMGAYIREVETTPASSAADYAPASSYTLPSDSEPRRGDVEIAPIFAARLKEISYIAQL